MKSNSKLEAAIQLEMETWTLKRDKLNLEAVIPSWTATWTLKRDNTNLEVATPSWTATWTPPTRRGRSTFSVVTRVVTVTLTFADDLHQVITARVIRLEAAMETVSTRGYNFHQTCIFMLPFFLYLSSRLLLNTTSSNVNPTPTYPQLIWHAGLDEIVSLDTVKQYVAEQCIKGANIQFQSIPLTEHISALVLGVPGVVEFLTKIFDHTTTQMECGSSRSDLPTLLSPIRARKILGNKSFKFLYSLYGHSLVGTTLKVVFEQIQDSEAIKQRIGKVS